MQIKYWFTFIMMLPIISYRNAEYSYADVGLRHSSAQQQNSVALNPPVPQATENDDGLYY